MTENRTDRCELLILEERTVRFAVRHAYLQQSGRKEEKEDSEGDENAQGKGKKEEKNWEGR